MSAIEDAKNAAPKTAKTYKDIYNGGATVKEVNPLEPRWTDGLTEEEAAQAFDIQLIVTPDDAAVSEQEIVLSYSARKGAKSNLTDAQNTIRDLAKHGLVTGDDISTVFAPEVIGKKCMVSVYEETSAKGTFTRCRLSRGQAKLSQADIMKRIAAMTGKAPAATAAPAATSFNPFA